ncbi:MAG: tRNA (guanosine(46)-N7)-methyltransferase TrmB [Campylobacteraceae bacterium]|jgi:tRNA (guanine-N7-)-methyltransferase|nr:tRNA (guanosine(46)-N7)-methyltransferase TrmB [Campylobacteraceae bacterium]
MPNFHTEVLNIPSLPFCEDGYNFCWAAKHKNSTLILVKKGSENFFLNIYSRNGSFLVKGEKISRPTQVIYLQEALNIFAKHSNAKPTFSNIKPASNRYKKNSTILKDIDFFAQNSFTNKDEILLEIGFGSGRHLLHQAKQNPEKLVIGVEIHKPSIEQVIKQCDALKMENVVLIDYDARVLLEFLPSNSVSKIFVHFPVPWDKKPHRRVISDSFVDEAIRVLKQNGQIELRTDSDLYYEYSLEIFNNFDKNSVKVIKNQDIEISSKYEDRWKKMQKNIYELVLTNKISSDEIQTPNKLIFNKLNFDRIGDEFKSETYVRDDFFVRFISLHAGSNNLVIKLAFGDTQKAEQTFILVDENGESCYFPKSIYATKANREVHSLIRGLLLDE